MCHADGEPDLGLGDRF